MATQPAKMDGVAFWDVETTGLDDDSAITVAVITMGMNDPQIFHSGEGNVMSVEKAVEMLTVLEEATTVVTFNGAAFDFKRLAHVIGDHERVATVAARHVDILFQFVANTG